MKMCCQRTMSGEGVWGGEEKVERSSPPPLVTVETILSSRRSSCSCSLNSWWSCGVVHVCCVCLSKDTSVVHGLIDYHKQPCSLAHLFIMEVGVGSWNRATSILYTQNLTSQIQPTPRGIPFSIMDLVTVEDLHKCNQRNDIYGSQAYDHERWFIMYCMNMKVSWFLTLKSPMELLISTAIHWKHSIPA